MAIGASYDLIMGSTMWELQAFDRAHEQSLREHDSLNYISGEYQFEAVMAALGNALAKKGSQSKSFVDLRKEPALGNIGPQEETEEIDEERAYEIYRMNREIDKLNWDLAQIYANKGE